MRKKTKLVHGVGINDADYPVRPRLKGVRVFCPIYLRWAKMLERAYDNKHKERHPTYNGCTVCDEWLTFSSFHSWLTKQDWQGKEIDKDILFLGNKVYSPDTCVLVSQDTNKFLLDCISRRGKYAIGVYFNKTKNKFRSQCKNNFTKKNESLGYFASEKEAHLSWKKRKHELACQLADLQTDERVAAALRVRYL